jgi:hypothetical protein
MSDVNYLIDLYLDTHYQEYITGEDDEGKYEVCNMCKSKIYEYSSVLPLDEGCCYECMFGVEGEINYDR